MSYCPKCDKFHVRWPLLAGFIYGVAVTIIGLWLCAIAGTSILTWPSERKAVEAQKMRDYELMTRLYESREEVYRRYCVCDATKPERPK